MGNYYFIHAGVIIYPYPTAVLVWLAYGIKRDHIGLSGTWLFIGDDKAIVVKHLVSF